jgi:preprotein translocase subunit SecB
MNDENDKTGSEDGARNIAKPQKIYLKDVSFESPHTPEIFTSGWKPNLDLDVESHARQIAADTYDVVMKVTAKASIDESTAFLAEVQQAGIFVLKGFDPEKLQRVQNVFCLRILYPYASAALADLITKGGFPSFMLPPMNFAAIYDQRLQNLNRPAADPAVTI